jgi:heparan-alpha-glucosaminide N-acetyltransferase
MIASPSPVAPAPATPISLKAERVKSIDALRGLVMFSMIFVNDLAGVSREIVPWWMRHFKANGNGMTFVDLVFPAFLFIVGMSIPMALGARLKKGEPLWQTILHILTRTASLLLVGIVMVNDSPDSSLMGWSAPLWASLMFLSAILAFSSLGPPTRSDAKTNPTPVYRHITLALRIVGFLLLIYLVFAFRGRNNHRIITLAPFSIHTSWYGILGLIGWAYLVGATVFLLFGAHRTALLGCTALLLCVYSAARKGAFDNFWLNHYVGIGSTLGSQPAITVAGLLLGSILVTSDTATVRQRSVFTLLFVAACAGAALLLHGLYGINKNSATPSWCLWACAITATLWLVFYYLCDVRSIGCVTKPFAAAGENVFLAYLLSEMLPSVIDLLHLDNWYGHLAEPHLAYAIARSAGCALFILLLTALLNRSGFRLRL